MYTNNFLHFNIITVTFFFIDFGYIDSKLIIKNIFVYFMTVNTVNVVQLNFFELLNNLLKIPLYKILKTQLVLILFSKLFTNL